MACLHSKAHFLICWCSWASQNSCRDPGPCMSTEIRTLGVFLEKQAIDLQTAATVMSILNKPWSIWRRDQWSADCPELVLFKTLDRWSCGVATSLRHYLFDKMWCTKDEALSWGWKFYLLFHAGLKEAFTGLGEGEFWFKEGSRSLGPSSRKLPSLFSSLVLFGFPFSMAAKEEKISTMYLEHHSKSTPASFNPFTPPMLTPEEAKAWRKIDMRLMPIFALLFLFSFLGFSLACVSLSSTGNIG